MTRRDIPTSVRLYGELADTVRGRQEDGMSAGAVIRRDLERYYHLLTMPSHLALADALVGVGETHAADGEARELLATIVREAAGGRISTRTIARARELLGEG